MLSKRWIEGATACVALACLGVGARAENTSCGSLPSYSALKTALASATAAEKANAGGCRLHDGARRAKAAVCCPPCRGCAAVGVAGDPHHPGLEARPDAHSIRPMVAARRLRGPHTHHLADLDGSANPTAGARGAPLAGTRFVQDFGESKLSALFKD